MNAITLTDRPIWDELAKILAPPTLSMPPQLRFPTPKM